MPATFGQTARFLEHSAVLAEDHSQREGQVGRRDAAAKERLIADQAREPGRGFESFRRLFGEGPV